MRNKYHKIDMPHLHSSHWVYAEALATQQPFVPIDKREAKIDENFLIKLIYPIKFSSFKHVPLLLTFSLVQLYI